jgi:hypothetical protein
MYLALKICKSTCESVTHFFGINSLIRINVNHEFLRAYPFSNHVATSVKVTTMAPALMFPEPRRDASQVVNAPIDPAQALLRRYTHWEKRLENLISFFSLIQRFQKIHSKQYLDLSKLASHRFGLEENFHQDGIISIWRGLKDKTAELGRFYDGLQESYNNTVINELNMRLQDIQMFKAEINRLRTNEAAAVAKKQKKFLDSVGDLGVSINSMRTRSAKLDPFVVNRSTFPSGGFF